MVCFNGSCITSLSRVVCLSLGPSSSMLDGVSEVLSGVLGHVALGRASFLCTDVGASACMH